MADTPHGNTFAERRSAAGDNTAGAESAAYDMDIAADETAKALPPLLARRAPSFRIQHALLVGTRVVVQLRRDPRFLMLAALVPAALVVILRYTLDALGGLEDLGVNTGNYAIPAGAFLVHFLAYVLSAIALVRERVTGTLERMFVSTLHKSEIVAGYVLGYSLIAAMQTVVVMGMTWWLFDVSLASRIVPVFLTVFILAMASIAMGLLVSSTARSEGQIFPFIPLIVVPSLVLSGLLIPFHDLALPLKMLARLFPLTYAEDVLVPIFDRGADFVDRIGYFAALVGYTVALLTVASLTLRERE